MAWATSAERARMVYRMHGTVATRDLFRHTPYISHTTHAVGGRWSIQSQPRAQTV